MKKVKCPNCGKMVEWRTESRWRPFCSERCQQIDLGAWASDSFVIPGAPLESDGLSDQLDPQSASRPGKAD
ncbi:MAG: DNA gyrase inhibitor YacG [Pigmentiphaga sp.]|nr:DNA gyrase inhibitor YacG [Pigmentiphaga sp.]